MLWLVNKINVTNNPWNIAKRLLYFSVLWAFFKLSFLALPQRGKSTSSLETVAEWLTSKPNSHIVDTITTSEHSALVYTDGSTRRGYIPVTRSYQYYRQGNVSCKLGSCEQLCLQIILDVFHSSRLTTLLHCTVQAFNCDYSRYRRLTIG